MPSRQLGKKEGGVKLLDIAAAKKWKRQQDLEDAKRAAEEAATEVRNMELKPIPYFTYRTSDTFWPFHANSTKCCEPWVQFFFGLNTPHPILYEAMNTKNK